jgi:hypothetical protein
MELPAPSYGSSPWIVLLVTGGSRVVLGLVGCSGLRRVQ